MKPEEWIVGDDTGRSSKTIWAVMMAVVTEPRQCDSQYCTPGDPSDFGRCFRLLALIPSWKERLPEVAVMFPAWKPFVREWDKMQTLYIQEKSVSGSAPKLFELMQQLSDEGRILDGWKRDGPNCWTRGKSMSVKLGGGVTIYT